MRHPHFLLLLWASMLTPGLMWTDDGQVIELDGFLKRIYSRIAGGEQKAISKEVYSQKENVQGQKGDFRRIAGPEVLTKNGRIHGKTLDKAHVFYGVPYAGPPTGAYRWKPPRAVSPWTGVYDATFPRAACMQACAGLYSQECPKQVRVDWFQMFETPENPKETYTYCRFLGIPYH